MNMIDPISFHPIKKPLVMPKATQANKCNKIFQIIILDQSFNPNGGLNLDSKPQNFTSRAVLPNLLKFVEHLQ